LANEKEQVQPIIIKKIKKGGGGHHGGAWKVAYADFVTAMMAFFLLLWLLNVTTSEEKTAISNYFDPTHPKISSSQSGAGGVLGGLSMSPQGAMVTTVQPISQPQVKDTTTRGEKKGDIGNKKEEKSDSEIKELLTKDDLSAEEKEQLEKQLEKIENERFEGAQEQIKLALENSPELAGLSDHLLMDITPEGLRIQIIDKEGRSMFPIGGTDMYAFMAQLIGKVSSIITALPNHISVRGHTDSAPYPQGAKYNNWDLSSDRAQSSRRALTDAGFPEARIETVVGRADRDHLIPEAPLSAQNRRISIVLLRDRLTRKEPASTEDLQEKLQQQGQEPAPSPSFSPDVPNTTEQEQIQTPQPQPENPATDLKQEPVEPEEERRRILVFP